MNRLLVMQSTWDTVLLAEVVGEAAFRTWVIEGDDDQVLEALNFHAVENGHGAFVWEGTFDQFDGLAVSGNWRRATGQEIMYFARGQTVWQVAESLDEALARQDANDALASAEAALARKPRDDEES